VADPGPPVEVALTIAARPETTFRYFTDPARFARWMGVGSVLEAEPGGRLRVGYPTGQVAAGRVVEVEPDRRIVFTWGYEGDGQAVPASSSTVEIALEPEAGGTRVRLRQTGLPAGEPPMAHLAGWRHALASLAYAGSADQRAEHADAGRAGGRLAGPLERARPGPAGGPAGALPGRRRSLPRPDGRRRRRRAAGRPHRFGWAAVGPGEAVVATGTNVAGADLDGRFRWVTGFWDPAPAQPEPPQRP
jgi:uncharacterized protein YndB with AHSA1/START domain